MLQIFTEWNSSSANFFFSSSFFANIHLNVRQKLGQMKSYLFHQNLRKMRLNKFIERKTFQNCVAPDIGQCLAKNQVMYDESCFTKDTLVQREVQKKLPSSSLLCFFLFMNILIDNLSCSFRIFKATRCVWVKRFYTNTLLFFALVETASHLKHFICHV